jgi:hypothetical protein
MTYGDSQLNLRNRAVMFAESAAPYLSICVSGARTRTRTPNDVSR